jgi:hypothetical protein
LRKADLLTAIEKSISRHDVTSHISA